LIRRMILFYYYIYSFRIR